MKSQLVKQKTDCKNYTECSRVRCRDGKYEEFRDMGEIMKCLANAKNKFLKKQEGMREAQGLRENFEENC